MTDNAQRITITVELTEAQAFMVREILDNAEVQDDEERDEALNSAFYALTRAMRAIHWID